MGAISTHPAYAAAAPQWSRARDVFAGEDAVKSAGEKYLPRLDSQSDEEYAAYKARASFFGGTARTLEEYLDLVFRRAPVVGVGEGKSLEPFVGDCDLWGLDFLRYARRAVSEVLSVGRGGSLVLWDESAKRPCASFWRTEDIVNWSVERVAQTATLVSVALRDAGRIRVLRLDGTNGTNGTNGAECVMEVWTEGGGAWSVQESAVLKRDGVPLPFIPFVVHGPEELAAGSGPVAAG